MKKLHSLLAVILVLGANVQADVITQWNFNDTSTTNSPAPSTGSGTAALLGGVVGSFSAGAITDPASPNNAWSAKTYPAATTGNKTAGFQYAVSTVDRENIVVTWDQQNSDTATRYVRFQYSLDGTTFIDGPVITMTVGGVFITNTLGADLTAITGVNNNANFKFRIVAEFESTATGSGTNAYVATKAGSNYNASQGTTRFDMMTVSGNFLPGANQPPTITGVSNQTIRVNTSTGPLSFTVNDVNTPTSLIFSGNSSNLGLVPTNNIVFGGTGTNKTVTITPAADQIGTATITLRVTDPGSLFTSTNFVLTVLPTNTAPIMPPLPTANGITNNATLVSFTVNDLETPETLNITATSLNQYILPSSNIVAGGSGSNKTVTLTSVGGYSGPSMVAVTANDGLLSTTSNFVFYAAPNTNILLIEGFDYQDGSLNTNSGFVWRNHSGTAGETRIVSGKAQISSTKSEDINAPLVGAPYDPNLAGPLFAKITFSVTALPTATNGDYFAHFKDSTSSFFRGKVFISTNGAAPGSYHVGISAGANFPSIEVAQDLALNSTHTVVTRYNVGTGVTTLWLDPTSQGDPSIVALDSATTGFISTYAFRQNTNVSSGMGTVLIDHVVVADNFTDALYLPATITLPAAAVPLSITRNGPVQISWSTNSAGFVLQSNDDLTTTNWQNVAQSPTISGTNYVIDLGNPGNNKFYRLKQ